MRIEAPASANTAQVGSKSLDAGFDSTATRAAGNHADDATSLVGTNVRAELKNTSGDEVGAIAGKQSELETVVKVGAGVSAVTNLGAGILGGGKSK
jgi:hypothetical protein